MKSHMALAALAVAASGAAQAFSCAPTGNAECRLELGTVTIVFESGVYNFDGDTQFNGSDGYATGYTVGAGQFPELEPLEAHGGLSAGFAFVPGMAAWVGGSGFEGTHEAFVYYSFSAMQFIPRPGYRLDGVELTVTGALTKAGNGYVGLYLPISPVFSGDSFTMRHVYGPETRDFFAGFFATASYMEGDDGTAADYGTASASFSWTSLVAHVSAVPEPGTASLWLRSG